MNHTGHRVFYVVGQCVAEAVCGINDDGNVELLSPFEVVDIDGDPEIYCDDCRVRVHAGNDGLGLEWVVV